MLRRLGPWAWIFIFGLATMFSAPTLPAGADTGLDRKKAPAESSTYLISPANGAVVTNPVVVLFGLKGMGVAPAGVEKAGTGHHHLLIDTDLPPLDRPIPNDAQHRHYGGGQTEAILELAPGEHSLQLILGDERHIPHDPPVVSERILIRVE